MKYFFALLVLIFTQSYAVANKCDLKIINQSKYNESSSSHEIILKDRKVSVGGSGELFPPNFDHLAAQRIILSCAPAFLECSTRSKEPVHFVISFRLTPQKGKAKNVSVLSNMQYVNDCISATISSIHFDFALSAEANIKMPVKIQ